MRNELTFKEKPDLENRQLINKMLTLNSVSLHIRRVDYLKKRRYDTVGSVCSKLYCERAINYIKSKVEAPFFFIFSDNISCVKDNFNTENSVFVDINHGNASYRDMMQMSYCKHEIIANSSFS